MKVLLTALNSKYIHSSLAIRYLEKYCNNYKGENNYRIETREFSINEPLDQIMAEIYQAGAGLVAFSVYIWNVDHILSLIDRLKKVSPDLLIVAGGPEVTYDPVETLEDNPALDIIVKGEGEETFKELLAALADRKKEALEKIPGLVYRDEEGKIRENQERELICNLDTIPFPYSEEEMAGLRNKIIYYEASRGCPYNCSYCLSSTIKGVRAFPLQRVKEDLLFLIKNKVKQVKFVDRTFNYDKKRAREIFEFLMAHKGASSFHFEITAELLDDDLLELLKSAPEGLFQFEIGVQTTNEKTLNLIERRMSFERLARNVQVLRQQDNIKLYLDLIAGLPGEDYNSFQDSFDQVYNLNPHVLQLGFLKLLKGSKVRAEAGLYNYKYTSEAPYEVLENEDISYAELLKLKNIEYVLDKYHNSGVFANSLKYIFRQHYQSYFDFYGRLADYFQEKGLLRIAHSRLSLYNILYDFYKEKLARNGEELGIFTAFLKYDLLLHEGKVKLPAWAESPPLLENFNEWRYRFLDDENKVEEYLPHLLGKRVQEILKLVCFEVFNYDPPPDYPWSLNIYNQEGQGTGHMSPEKGTYIILFDYSKRKQGHTGTVLLPF